MNGQKAIIFDVCDVLFHFNPTHKKSAEKFIPLNDGIALLKQCHRSTTGTQPNKLFILSNISTNSYEILRKFYHEIMNLFDGVVVSGNVQWRKPNVHIYQHLIQQYKLNAQKCIFIDDKKVNVLVAKSIGMHGIVYDDADSVRKQLKKLEVL